MNKIDLTEMKPGQKGKVIEIHGGRGMIGKLEALGIRLGVEIMMVSGQMMHGPVIVQFGNTQVAIGFGMARRVIIELVDKTV